MHKSIKFLVIAIGIAASIISCTKDITIKPIPYEAQTTIECILVPGTRPVLYLTTSVPFFDPAVTPSQLFARGASVSISGPNGIDVLIEDSVFNNFRCRWEPFYHGSIVSQQGGTYNLTVIYNGKTYTSSTTIYQSQVNMSSVTFINPFHDIYGEHEGVVVEFTDATGQENYYRYQMGRMIDSTVYGASNLGLIHSTCVGSNFFYVRELGRSIYNDKGLDGQPLTFTVEPAYKHQQDDSTYVILQSLDSASADFYDQLDKQKLAQLNPFVEPVFIKTKIEGCIGVFGSQVPSDSVLFVYPE